MHNLNDTQRELYVWITTSCAAAMAQHDHLARLYEHRRAKGTYNRTLAAKGLLHAVGAGAKDYVHHFGGKDDRWHTMFKPADRLAVAQAMRDDLENEWACGNSWLERAA